MTREGALLLAVDGSVGAAHALAFVKALRAGTRDEVVVASRPSYILAARPGDASLASRLAASARGDAQQLVDGAASLLRAAAVEARGVVSDGDDVVDALIRAVERERASVVVVGSRGRGPWSSILLGSTARALAILSPVPVLVIRRPEAPRRVLIATDGSPAALAAIGAVARLGLSDAAVELLAILPPAEGDERTDEEALAIRESVEHAEEDVVAARLERERALLGADARAHADIERGHVGTTILDRADQMGADLIALGTRGMAGPRARFWGSTAERVLTHATCNVLIAPAPAAADPRP